MPELGEVAHAVSLLRAHLLNKTIRSIAAPDDDLLYVKPLTGTEFARRLLNSKVTDVGRNGKYFWLELNNAFTVLMHFGMTGWVYIRNAMTHYSPMEQGGDKKLKQWHEKLALEGKVGSDAKFVAEWPPKYIKFELTLEDGQEVAFADPRRLGRIRVLECKSRGVADFDPVSKLGTDFSQADVNDKELKARTITHLLTRKAALKSVLLDQHIFSGIGNWMADEILYQSRLHPMQRACSLTQEKAAQLYDTIVHVCQITAAVEGNTALFPKTWLMIHRWGKARKGVQTTADGSVIEFLTVGGRTSCYVPSLQKMLPDDANDTQTKQVPSEGHTGTLKSDLKIEPDLDIENGGENRALPEKGRQVKRLKKETKELLESKRYKKN